MEGKSSRQNAKEFSSVTPRVKHRLVVSAAPKEGASLQKDAKGDPNHFYSFKKSYPDIMRSYNLIDNPKQEYRKSFLPNNNEAGETKCSSERKVAAKQMHPNIKINVKLLFKANEGKSSIKWEVPGSSTDRRLKSRETEIVPVTARRKGLQIEDIIMAGNFYPSQVKLESSKGKVIKLKRN